MSSLNAMDAASRRFARAVALSSTRRDFLRTALGVTTAAGFTLAFGGTEEAKACTIIQACGPSPYCPGGSCNNVAWDCVNNPGGTCVNATYGHGLCGGSSPGCWCDTTAGYMCCDCCCSNATGSTCTGSGCGSRKKCICKFKIT